jgi:hypothetical protein
MLQRCPYGEERFKLSSTGPLKLSGSAGFTNQEDRSNDPFERATEAQRSANSHPEDESATTVMSAPKRDGTRYTRHNSSAQLC